MANFFFCVYRSCITHSICFNYLKYRSNKQTLIFRFNVDFINHVVSSFWYICICIDVVKFIIWKNISKYHSRTEKASSYYIQDASIIDEIRKDNKDYVSQLSFLSEEGFPFYHNTGFEYYAPCENGFDGMLKELKKRKNIFLWNISLLKKALCLILFFLY